MVHFAVVVFALHSVIEQVFVLRAHVLVLRVPTHSVLAALGVDEQ